jgi:perosamine synthetase
MNTDFKKIISFIRSVYACPKAHISLHEPRFIGNEKKYITECIDTNFVSSVGKFVNLFEERIASYTGAKYAVACVNGTSALHLALKILEVREGDEVITQPLTFIATANAISYCNAKPVFLDIDKDTLGLSPDCLNEFLIKNAKVKNGACFNKKTKRKISACIPVHVFGHPCRIDEIVKICKNYFIPVIEDSAESMGSLYRHKHTGTFGKIGILSFNGNKIITTGAGGMLLFNDRHLARHAKHLSTQAKVPHKWEFNHDETGFNFRMPNINAALGIAQLESLPFFLKQKRELAKKYEEFFKEIGTPFFKEPLHARSNYWLNTIMFKNLKERDSFLKYANKEGVMARPAWRLMNDLPMFKNCQVYNIMNASMLADRIVNIPSTPLVIARPAQQAVAVRQAHRPSNHPERSRGAIQSPYNNL